MIVSIHQPQYLPWLPYFDKILQSDVFVYLDHVQFQKNGVQNRNKIKTSQGEQWLTVPVRQKLGQSIESTEIVDARIFSKHLKSMESNYKKAPFFNEIFPLISETLESGFKTLGDLCCHSTDWVLDYLNYSGKRVKSSALDIDASNSEMILKICHQFDARTYLSGQGGKEYLDLEEFSKAKIAVEFQKYDYPEYGQLFPKLAFIPHLSMMDLLFNEGPKSREILMKGRLQNEVVS